MMEFIKVAATTSVGLFVFGMVVFFALAKLSPLALFVFWCIIIGLIVAACYTAWLSMNKEQQIEEANKKWVSERCKHLTDKNLPDYTKAIVEEWSEPQLATAAWQILKSLVFYIQAWKRA